MMVTIRPAREEELAILNQKLPVNIPRFHEEQIEEQKKGKSVWLIGWIDGEPVGHLELRWRSKMELIREKIDGPEIGAVGVKEERRRQGIGTQLTAEAIRLAKEKGYKGIGLAVGTTDNPYARTMYEKLGFKDSGLGEVVDSWTIIKDGKEIEESEVCVYLVKRWT